MQGAAAAPPRADEGTGTTLTAALASLRGSLDRAAACRAVAAGSEGLAAQQGTARYSFAATERQAVSDSQAGLNESADPAQSHAEPVMRALQLLGARSGQQQPEAAQAGQRPPPQPGLPQLSPPMLPAGHCILSANREGIGICSRISLSPPLGAATVTTGSWATASPGGRTGTTGSGSAPGSPAAGASPGQQSLASAAGLTPRVLPAACAMPIVAAQQERHLLRPDEQQQPRQHTQQPQARQQPQTRHRAAAAAVSSKQAALHFQEDVGTGGAAPASTFCAALGEAARGGGASGASEVGPLFAANEASGPFQYTFGGHLQYQPGALPAAPCLMALGSSERLALQLLVG